MKVTFYGTVYKVEKVLSEDVIDDGRIIRTVEVKQDNGIPLTLWIRETPGCRVIEALKQESKL